MKNNNYIANKISEILDELAQKGDKTSYKQQITYVKDRPGHDRMYAIGVTKVENELGWKARFNFKDALSDTVDWYLNNQNWVQSVQSGDYRNWIEKNYDNR